MPKPTPNLIGKKFGKLEVIQFSGYKQGKDHRSAYWLCKCDCGNTIEVKGVNLRIGNTKSCGCLTKKHGMFGTRIYNLWHTMKERCYVPSHISYANYGGKGIKVCDEWQEFIPFMKWAYENGYDENAPRGKCTLDRIDPSKDYCPQNCRFVDWSIQANNKSTNVYLEYNGIIDTLSNHARNVGLDPRIAESRKIKGDSVERIFRDTRKARTLEYRGKIYKIDEFCKKFKVSRSPLERRVFKNGESPESALKNIKNNQKRPMKKNRKVLQYDLSMVLLKEWKNLTEIEKELGFSRGSIGNCCLGYSKTSFGYIWQYAD